MPVMKLQMLYKATIDGIFSFGMSRWGGNASKQDKNRLNKNMEKAGGERARKHRHRLSSTGDKLTVGNFGYGETTTET